MNPRLDAVLQTADRVIVRGDRMNGGAQPSDGAGASAQLPTPGALRVGVDLGTAYTVVVVVDEEGMPCAGEYRFAQVVRDGVVVDFVGAVDLVKKIKANVERRLGVDLVSAAGSFPPGVSPGEVKAVRYVIESAGLECSTLIDEPSAADSLLQVENAAVVDIGGGTTGIAVIQNGKVVYTGDEPTGGTHLSLVLAGAHKVSFEEAEAMKTDPTRHRELLPVVRPVMEKMGTIIAAHLRSFQVDCVYLVGGTSSFAGIAEVVEAVVGVPTVVPGNPLFVTPIGIAMNDVRAGVGAMGR